jgi:2-polyprenyl-6-methoxyphenol hydroxylase-like FAD-dependent oxidoreductase
VILGDAAYTIPPSAGQGIKQALEDVYMFALLLSVRGGAGFLARISAGEG